MSIRNDAFKNIDTGSTSKIINLYQFYQKYKTLYFDRMGTLNFYRLRWSALYIKISV